jgi:hypothetical protein
MKDCSAQRTRRRLWNTDTLKSQFHTRDQIVRSRFSDRQSSAAPKQCPEFWQPCPRLGYKKRFLLIHLK